MLLKDIVNRNARMYPQRTATVWGNKQHTFLEFKERVNQVANALIDLDVIKGDRVGVLLRNCSPYIELHFAIPQGGMIVVPFNYRNREKELTDVVRNSGVNTIFVGSEYTDIINSIRKDIPGVKNFISLGKRVDGYLEFEELVSQYPASEPKVELSEEDVIVLGYTSGTTGRAKGAMITQKNLLTEVKNSHATIPLSHRDVGLNLFPYFHIGFCRCTVYMAMGAKNICADFEPQLACELIEKEGVTQLAMSPAQVNILVNYPEVTKYDLSSLRKVICGGGHATLEMIRKFFDLVSKDFEIFWFTFGQTEASPCVCGNTIRREMLGDMERKMNSLKGIKPTGISVGWAYPYCEIRIVDENDEDKPAREIGEIICRGDNIMKGYWRQPEATEETLRNGWLHTADLGMFTDEGELYVVDRKKDMILSGDENIYPAEIEEVLHSHPAILEAAVIGVPDQKWGETVKAVVVLKEEARATPDEIIRFCKEKLSSYKKPTSVDFLNQLPRNPSGKVLKTELRKPYWGEKR